ncbi:hypothetical protein Glove_198g46 [Diversispora epigaea]|uniref:Uncharacterized protein n=1 Tax=Diversispora epigaea TaxID=1348612 RepID=A0A397IKD2_9GLOM|nr:hypothetical protein Glove_198g46 [Diversispora epigaea]
MLSRLFLITTLLLVGITTVTIGVPVAETIVDIKAVELPQMGSGNLTLNRRFIPGVPGLPQCTDINYPELMSSWCLSVKAIRANCASISNPADMKYCDTTCPKDTVCLDFRLATTNNAAFSQFALCINKKDAASFNGEKGVICQSFAYVMESPFGTVAINVYDISNKPKLINAISVRAGKQYMSKSDTSNYSVILANMGKQKLKVCLQTASNVALFALFAVIDGTYSSIGGK